MQLHLQEISATVSRRAHAVLLLDRAGWHTTARLRVPNNVTLVFLPSRSPELNPVEQIWQYIRANWLSNRVFETYDEIIDAACTPGTASSLNPQQSRPLACANGRMQVNHEGHWYNSPGSAARCRPRRCPGKEGDQPARSDAGTIVHAFW